MTRLASSSPDASAHVFQPPLFHLLSLRPPQSREVGGLESAEGKPSHQPLAANSLGAPMQGSPPKPPTPGSGTPTSIPSNHRGWTSTVANPARLVAAPRPMVSLAGTGASSQLQAGPPPGLGLSGSRTAPPAVVVAPVSASYDPVPDSWKDDT